MVSGGVGIIRIDAIVGSGVYQKDTTGNRTYHRPGWSDRTQHQAGGWDRRRLLLTATDWGEVSVVQALDGLKFVFVLIISYGVTLWSSNFAPEHHWRPKRVVRQVVYVLIIVLGFSVLFL